MEEEHSKEKRQNSLRKQNKDSQSLRIQRWALRERGSVRVRESEKHKLEAIVLEQQREARLHHSKGGICFFFFNDRVICIFIASM